uniref:Minor capsid protein P11 C-terminal conserved region domain-containing protein n=1 Tax=Nucleocytoviricota sp. TaxID=2809609 RepID=A0A9E8G3Y6_9VIRU|nr:hypothetical protein [Nucleocytoviricota sp.]UZT29260.1 hypothetical protein [Nucleocytoviricota sp.]
MDFVKSLEKFVKSQTFFIVLALVVLVVGFNYYSNNKSSLLSGFRSLETPPVQSSEGNTSVNSPVQGVSESPEVGAPISGIAGPAVQNGNCTAKQISNPADLLPRDTNSEWAQLNPNGVGDLQNISLLKAGHHIGINTVGSNLRNANLQIRSEPVIPKSSVGPWLNSTIEPDCVRPKLEIGGPSC